MPPGHRPTPAGLAGRRRPGFRWRSASTPLRGRAARGRRGRLARATPESCIARQSQEGTALAPLAHATPPGRRTPAMTELKRIGSLEIDEDMGFHERMWAV